MKKVGYRAEVEKLVAEGWEITKLEPIIDEDYEVIANLYTLGREVRN